VQRARGVKQFPDRSSPDLYWSLTLYFIQSFRLRYIRKELEGRLARIPASGSQPSKFPGRRVSFTYDSNIRTHEASKQLVRRKGVCTQPSRWTAIFQWKKWLFHLISKGLVHTAAVVCRRLVKLKNCLIISWQIGTPDWPEMIRRVVSCPMKSNLRECG
jgi:hypothetical protein